MKVLVTGASGFVGRHLVPELARQHDVSCVVRRQDQAPDLGGSALVEADLADPAFATRLPAGMDIVVHLAQAYLPFPARAAELFLVNTGSTHWLAEYARQTGVGRFVLASSGSVYRPAVNPLHEDAATVPPSYHPATKLMSEMVLQHYAPFFSIGVLRLFAPYGRGQIDRLLPRMIDSIRAGNPISLSRGGEPRINPIYITDLVRIMVEAIGQTGTYTVNVAGPAAASIRDLAMIIGRHVGQEPIFEARDVEPSGDFVADTTLMHELFSVGDLVSLNEGLRLMIDAHLHKPN